MPKQVYQVELFGKRIQLKPRALVSCNYVRAERNKSPMKICMRFGFWGEERRGLSLKLQILERWNFGFVESLRTKAWTKCKKITGS